MFTPAGRSFGLVESVSAPAHKPGQRDADAFFAKPLVAKEVREVVAKMLAELSP